MPGNPSDRVIHLAVFVGAQVEDPRLGPRRLFHRGQDRIDAIPDVQVRLLLAPVAEYPQVGRIAAERLVEVEYVAVRVALTKDRDEAENESLEPESLAIRFDQSLARELRRAVERGLDRKRRCLRSREHRRITIDRSGRRERDA